MNKSEQQAKQARIHELEEIDSICLQYEDSLLRPEAVKLAEFLNMVPETCRAAVLQELLPIHAAYCSGIAAQSEREDLKQRHPSLADLIDAWAAPAATCTGLQRAAARFRRGAGDGPDAQYFGELNVLAPGTRIAAYMLESAVGHGAFGRIYRAIDMESGEVVAIKIPSSPDPLRLPDAVDRLRAEAETLRRLQHPGIVSFRAVEDHCGMPALVMDFVDGPTLRQMLDSKSLSLRRIAEIFSSVADAMEMAHRTGVVHRDLEPSNIILQADEPRIVDFGLAVHEAEQQQLEGESAGSAAYMSPEQIRGDSHWLDGRADLWAIGVMLYEGFCGRRPFVSENLQTLSQEILNRDPRPPRQINPDIPPELERITLKCLSRSAASRYATAADLALDLRNWLVPPALQPANRFPGFHAGLILLAGAVLLAIGAGLWVNSEQGNDSTVAGSPAKALGASNSVVSIPDASLEIRVIRTQATGDNSSLVALSIASEGVLPLRVGDGIQVLADVSPDLNVVLIHIAVDATLTLIHEQHASSGGKHRLIQLPGSDLSFPVVAGPDGAEMIVLLGDRDPVSDRLQDLQFPALQSQVGDRLSMASFDGFLNQSSGPLTRGVEVDKSQAKRLPPVLANQQLIMEHFQNRFDVVRTVSFGVSGNERQHASGELSGG